jgi:hypothetical protein
MPDSTPAWRRIDASLDQPVDQKLQRDGNAEAKRLRDAAGLAAVHVDCRWFEHRDEKEARRGIEMADG